MKTYKYLFGPVPSRRLGRSLGIDLVPLKTCTLDCVFCQLGRTSRRTLDRREYAPLGDVTAELADWLETGGRADYLTLAGSGEPTLHRRFGGLLDFARRHSSIPTALLTNGTTLHLPDVRRAAAKADLVKVSLSAWDQASFERINRPDPEFRFDRLVESYRTFRAEFKGTLWLEVFVVSGFNSAPADMRRIAALAADIRPDRVHLNTAARPPAEKSVVAVPESDLRELAGLFAPPAEVIAEFRAEHAGRSPVSESAVLAALQRHPGTAAQLADAFGADLDEISRHIDSLRRQGKLRSRKKGGETYYLPESG